MQLVKSGKTKDVFQLPNGHFLLKFKDSVTGHADGTVDPGANEVIGAVSGMGRACLGLTTLFFEKLEASNRVPLHFVSADVDALTMEVRPARVFGQGVEVIIRFVATGSFVRRYGDYVTDGQVLGSPLVEFTLKDDKRGDPPVSEDALAALGVMTPAQVAEVKRLALDVAGQVRAIAQTNGIDVFDMKVEFGLDDAGQVMLIDEISPGCMRAFKDGTRVEGPALAAAFGAI